MLYKAVRADGGPRVNLEDGGYCIVASEVEHRGKTALGWHDGQNEAIAAIHAEDREWSELAANRAANERTMSAKARAEANAVDESTIQHVPSIPETGIKSRGVK